MNSRLVWKIINILHSYITAYYVTRQQFKFRLYVFVCT